MANYSLISIEQVIETLVNSKKRFSSKYLYRLSDLEAKDLELIASSWRDIPLNRRQALMGDIVRLSNNNLRLSYEEIAHLAIKDEDAHIRVLAVRCLQDYEKKDLANQFLILLEEDESEEVRGASAVALGKYVYLGELEEIPLSLQREIEDRLIAKVNSQDATTVKRYSLEALGYSSRDEVQSLIETAYYSGNDDWLSSALCAMGASANEKWHKLVEAMFDHDNPEVRREAIRAAGELEHKGSVELLLKLLEDPDRDIRIATTWSLSQIGGEGVREALEQLANDLVDEESVDTEELDHVFDALDNLDFTEEASLFDIFDLSEIVDLDADDEEECFIDDEDSDD